MLRTVIPVRSASSLIVISPSAAALFRHAHHRIVSGNRWPFISAAPSEQRNAIASAMCSAGVKFGNSSAGLSSRIRWVRIASTTMMLAVAPRAAKPSASASVQASAAAFAAA